MLWRKMTNAIIEKTLTFAKGAKLYATSSTGVKTEIDMTELAALNSVASADVQKVVGITNGTFAASKAMVLNSSGNGVMPAAGMLALSRASIAAAGTTSANAAALTSQVNAITASDSVKGVVLPAAATTTGPIQVINTVSTARLLVYPVDSGDDAINGLSANVAYEVGPGEAVWFTPTSATQWFTSAASHLRTGQTLTATKAVGADESGKTFFLSSATEFVSTLPAPAAGLRYTFIVTAAPSGANYTIVTNGSSNIIKGSVYSSDLNAASDADFETAGGDTVNFVDSKAVAGDRVDVFCDGTNWFVYGFCTVFDAITIITAS
jgi:hypothetical protein